MAQRATSCCLVTVFRETKGTSQVRVLVKGMGEEFIFEILSLTQQRVAPEGAPTPPYTLPGVLRMLGCRSVSHLSSNRDALG